MVGYPTEIGPIGKPTAFNINRNKSELEYAQTSAQIAQLQNLNCALPDFLLLAQFAFALIVKKFGLRNLQLRSMLAKIELRNLHFRYMFLKIRLRHLHLRFMRLKIRLRILLMRFVLAKNRLRNLRLRFVLFF